ncbi:dihydroneopterin aldolase [Oscillatoriales cyanobacterium LEGE 11467]|uniref:7,8-dihydroneopterin aldolase n=1 Tax=Zarconia navalis LEGE 11467 TaxID=1828826 RepID=A0A928VY15_9CYAN|nr:dihydroneopterin aldolase [Zarconia navalis]MBE9042201.1 dihydroneopterin aldolase [Zarconia navalis LEGE 11467]
MDAIEISGLRYYGYTGYFAEEKKLGQWFEVDLTLSLDLATVGKSDRLEDTLNYCQAVDIVREHIETSKVDTIEHLAAQILRSLLKLDRIEKARVRLTKLVPPIPGFSGQIAVELTRTRDDSF